MSELTRETLDQEWSRLQQEREAFEKEKADFEAEREASGVEYKLWVGNLDEKSTKEDVESLFGAYGKVKEVHIMKERAATGKESAFVKYFTQKSSNEAIRALHDIYTDKDVKAPLIVRFAKQRQSFTPQQTPAPYSPSPSFQQNQASFAPSYSAQSYQPQTYNSSGYSAAPQFGPQGANLYVNNVPSTFSMDDFKGLFSRFGRVLSSNLFAHQGYGFVSFETNQIAAQAIQQMNGFRFSMDPTSKPLEVSIKKQKNFTQRYSPY